MHNADVALGCVGEGEPHWVPYYRHYDYIVVGVVVVGVQHHIVVVVDIVVAVDNDCWREDYYKEREQNNKTIY